MQGSGILTLMWDAVSEFWAVPAFMVGAYSVLALINAVKRGSNV